MENPTFFILWFGATGLALFSDTIRNPMIHHQYPKNDRVRENRTNGFVMDPNRRKHVDEALDARLPHKPAF